MTSNTPKVQENPSKPRQKVKLEDVEVSKKDNKGVSFLSGVLLIVLIVASIFSFSIVAIELGEIKRLWGLKELTEQQIQENEVKIDALKSDIVTLQDKKADHDRNASESNENARKQYQQYLFYESKRKESETKAEEALNTLKSSELKNDQLLLEITSNENRGADLLNQKNLLAREVEGLTKDKLELAKYPNLLSAAQAELKDAETQLTEVRTETTVLQKQKELSEEAAIRLQARIEELEKLSGKLMKDLASSEESLKIARKEKEKLDEQSAVLKGEANAERTMRVENQQRNNSLLQENAKLEAELASLKKEVSNLKETYGRYEQGLNALRVSYKKWEEALNNKKAEAQK